MQFKFKKHKLSTHFACANLAYSERDKTAKRITDAIIDCLGDVNLAMPVLYPTLTDGVYTVSGGFRHETRGGCHINYESRVYVVLHGIWYEYGNRHKYGVKSAHMFDHYQKQMEVGEMYYKDVEACVNIARTKYASGEQKQIARHAWHLKDLRKLSIQSKKNAKRLRARIAEIKKSRGVGSVSCNQRDSVVQ